MITKSHALVCPWLLVFCSVVCSRETPGSNVLTNAAKFLSTQESISVEIVGSLKGIPLYAGTLRQQIDYRRDGCVSIVQTNAVKELDIGNDGELLAVRGNVVKAKADGEYLYQPSISSDSYERHDSLKPLCNAANYAPALIGSAVYMEMVTGLNDGFSKEFRRAHYLKRERLDPYDCDVVSITVEGVRGVFWVERGPRNIPHRIDFIFDEGDQSETIVSTRFRNWRFSEPLPDELFEYSPPADFKEIRNPLSLFD